MKAKTLMAPLFGAVVASVIGASAHATTLLEMSFEEIVAGADAVVVGEAAESRTERTDQGVFTYTTFRVRDSIAGAPGSLVTVTTPGGRYSVGKFQLAETWAGAPRFAAGQRAVLFLDNAPSANGRRTSGNYAVVGFSQGALAIVQDGGRDAVRIPGGEIESLDSMKTRVRSMKRAVTEQAPDGVPVAD